MSTHITVTAFEPKVTYVVPKERIILKDKSFEVYITDFRTVKVVRGEYDRLKTILLHGEEHYERIAGKKT